MAQASQTAIRAVEANGGSLVSSYYNALGMRALLYPHKFDVLPRRARPKSKHMPYYLDHKNRGYLSTEMQLKASGLQALIPAEAEAN